MFVWLSVADLSTENGLMYLFMGWGTLLTQSLAQDFGRRPVLLFGILGSSLLQIWSAYIKSVGEWFRICICGQSYEREHGPAEYFILIAVLGVILWSGCLLWIKTGKAASRSIAKSYWNLVESWTGGSLRLQING
ncbi:unnamed protein product [Penicillium nalgiovense]|nr:unnamed protein product [Penicillium nalgiovense]